MKEEPLLLLSDLQKLINQVVLIDYIIIILGGIIMFSRIGTSELILILIIALVIFGPSKLPEIGRAIGTSIKEFKKSIGSISEDSENNNKKEN